MKKGNWIIIGKGRREIAIKTKPNTASPVNRNSVSYESKNGIRIRVNGEEV